MNSKETLVVRNFGPIKNIEVIVSPVTIFIGPQASGKSTLAKLLTILKYVTLNRQDFLSVEDIKKIFFKYNIDELLKKSTYISFDSDFFTITINQLKFSFELKQDIERSRKELNEMKKQLELIAPDINRLKTLVDEEKVTNESSALLEK